MHLSHLLATLPIVAAHVPGYLPPSKRNTIESRQSGPTTRNDPRPQLGNVQYGVAIRTCTVPGTVALTYDDGPNIYTGQLLDTLASYGFKATFFVSGDNGRGALDGDSRWVDLVRRMDAEGHQVASHTWTHSNLDEIPIAQKFDEMVKTEMAIRNILNKYPTYMRPPYAVCTGACLTVMRQLGYVIAQYDLETSDYANQANIQVSKDIFKSEMDRTSKQAGGRIVIAHDIHEQTVSSLTPYMLDYIKNNGWRAVTVGECLGDARENWYRPSQGSPPSTGCPPEGCAVSTNGLCGSQNGATCAGSVFGNCCSRFGYCGSSSDYCGADNCNPTYGTCGSGSGTTTTPSAPTPTASNTPPPTSTPQPAGISQNGLCGVQGGETCTGSVWGACCSQWGYCGDSDAHCTNCNSAFGSPCKS
ncbi:glycoside hydrolase/deacetylase [Phaeosphaeriaceae sp. SRC1lsM3a]|nr:glycoside hydrolase/deacetylase [Stagonospora sp. SRC1lsM3a]